jgi:hypothetical protein
VVFDIHTLMVNEVSMSGNWHIAQCASDILFDRTIGRCKAIGGLATTAQR